jgi:ketosteroid isomerase-like protein
MPANALTETEVRHTVARWYRALDRHDELAEVLPYLADDPLEMRLPETTVRGHAGFKDWYETVTARFFDEEHTVVSVDVELHGPTSATARVLVNWQAKVWDPPEPRSRWVGFDAYQTWELELRDGRPQVTTYSVDFFDPMPGSAAL